MRADTIATRTGRKLWKTRLGLWKTWEVIVENFGRHCGKTVENFKETPAFNWKKEAVDKLRNYDAMCCALKSIPVELRQLDTAKQCLRDAAHALLARGGAQSCEEAVEYVLTERKELRRQFKMAQLWMASVEDALDALDVEEVVVLDRFYIHRAPDCVDRLCAELHIEPSTVYRRRDKALRKFTTAMYGRCE